MPADNTKIGVAIVGASPDRGWAALAHIPALRSLPEYELRAISTSRRESADKASAQFGVDAAFDNVGDLVAHPGVDLVVVNVKVPQHLELVNAALTAGKMVYCEWPLGRDLAEAEAMHDMARSNGLKTMIGLQSRLSPAVKHVRALVQSGYVGEVLGTTLVGSGGGWGATIDPSGTYLLDDTTGATLLTIPFGHTVDALCWTLGEFQNLTATTAIRLPSVTVNGTGEVVQKTTPDQIAVSGVLENGAVASIHYRGGTTPGTNLRWEINGTNGDIVLTGPSGHLQMTSVEVRGRTGEEKELSLLTIPESESLAPDAPAGPPYNVAQMYAQFAADLRDGTNIAPDFGVAVQRHKMLKAIQEAARSGERQSGVNSKTGYPHTIL